MLNLLKTVNWHWISFQEFESLLINSDYTCDCGVKSVDQEINKLTPLCLASLHKREDLLTILLHHGAQPNKTSSRFNTAPLHLACSHKSGNLGVVRKLLESGAKVNAKDVSGDTGLHQACKKGNIPVAQLLIEYGADINTADLRGNTPLVRSCLAKSVGLTDLLLKSGSDPNCSEADLNCEWRPLAIAARGSSVELLTLLLQAGANMKNQAYLNWACEGGHTEMMKVYHKFGVDINMPDAWLGFTPLQSACVSRESGADCVQLLLDWGAELNTLSRSGAAALHYACMTTSQEKIRLLLDYSADINVLNTSCQSALLLVSKQFPVKEANIRIAQLLLSSGARISKEAFLSLRSTFKHFEDLDASSLEWKLLELLRSYIQQPLRLQDWCRLHVRASLKPDVDQKINSLPLPLQILRFLNFSDIRS